MARGALSTAFGVSDPAISVRRPRIRTLLLPQLASRVRDPVSGLAVPDLPALLKPPGSGHNLTSVSGVSFHGSGNTARRAAYRVRQPGRAALAPDRIGACRRLRPWARPDQRRRRPS